MVPQIRTSNYMSMFSESLPALRESTAGNIQEPSLPDLRNLVVINNTTSPIQFERDLKGLKSAIDWREFLAWQEDPAESRLIAEMSSSVDVHDVASLLFTR